MAEQDRKVNIVVGAENQAKGTFQEIKADAAEMANSVKKSGDEASKGIEGIGDGADKAAQKLARAEGSMAQELQRATEKAKIAAQAGDRSSRSLR
ncbi:hypothetical protein GCM10027082_14080 [Comamonas humi]